MSVIHKGGDIDTQLTLSTLSNGLLHKKYLLYTSLLKATKYGERVDHDSTNKLITYLSCVKKIDLNPLNTLVLFKNYSWCNHCATGITFYVHQDIMSNCENYAG